MTDPASDAGTAPADRDTDPVRVRFAPSPTGYLHIGGARTALFNYLFARQRGGRFVLRIEDTDRRRSTPENVQVILQGLRYLQLDWDEGHEVGGDHGPYFQSERAAEHEGVVGALLASGKAYRCFCSRERLAELRESQLAAKARVGYDGRCRTIDPEEAARREREGEPAVVRFAVEPGRTTIRDRIRGDVVFDHEEVDDFIVRRADGGCVYNLAVVADDHGMEITHVIRGEDHLTNTAKQALLFEALGWELPAYAHIPLILGPGRQKLSKRHGAVSVTEYADQGYLPEAMLNFLARMGWSYDDREEIFSRDDLIEKFSLQSVSRSGAMYDLKRLQHLGAHWMRQRSTAEIFELTWPRLMERGLLRQDQALDDRERLEAMVALEKERRENITEICNALEFYFRDFRELDAKAAKALRKQEGVADLLVVFADEVASAFDRAGSSGRSAVVASLEETARRFVEARDIGLKHLAQPVRAVLTGRTTTPPLFDVMALLGKEACVKRLREAPKWVEKAMKLK